MKVAVKGENERGWTIYEIENAEQAMQCAALHFNAKYTLHPERIRQIEEYQAEILNNCGID